MQQSYDGLSKPNALGHAQGNPASLRANNLRLSLSISEAMQDETGKRLSGSFGRWRRTPSDRAIFRDQPALTAFLLELDTTGELPSAAIGNELHVFLRVSEFQIWRLYEARRRGRVLLSRYAAVELARRRARPTALSAVAISRLRTKVADAERDIDYAIADLRELQADAAREPAGSGQEWGSDDLLGRSQKLLSVLHGKQDETARIIIECMKEQREITRVNLAVWGVAVALFVNAIVLAIPEEFRALWLETMLQWWYQSP
ncbi:MAG: hypothetical protein AAFR50_04925 [Pseudomonadota bacterium]